MLFRSIVERVLIKQDYPEIAKVYILYRAKRREARDLAENLPSALSLIEQYLDKSDWRINENSNMTYSLQGLNFNVSSSLVSRYWLNKIYPEEIRIAHDTGIFHMHDLGVLGPPGKCADGVSRSPTRRMPKNTPDSGASRISKLVQGKPLRRYASKY